MGQKMDSQFMGMIKEDRSAPGNLPKQVIQKQYPKTGFMGSHEIDDTMRGLDDTRKDDIRNIEKHMSSDKY
jgi:hypothetical protein